MKTKGIVGTLMLVVPLFCTSSICCADGFDSVHSGLTFDKLCSAAGCQRRMWLLFKRGTGTWDLRIWEVQRLTIADEIRQTSDNGTSLLS